MRLIDMRSYACALVVAPVGVVPMAFSALVLMHAIRMGAASLREIERLAVSRRAIRAGRASRFVVRLGARAQALAAVLALSELQILYLRKGKYAR